MSWIYRLLPFLRPTADAPSADVPPGRRAVLVEFLADRGRLEEELASLRDDAAAARAEEREAWSRLAEELATASREVRSALSQTAREIAGGQAGVTAAVREEMGRSGAGLAERLDGVTREVGKVSREQFRVTNLVEGQGAMLDELAEAWRTHLEEREREAASFRQALAELEVRVRQGLVVDLLPVGDALTESIRSARELRAALEDHRPPERSGLLGPFLDRLRTPHREELNLARERSAALESWAEGLMLVERRLLAFLERAGVEPISAIGLPFDPHSHLAVAVEAGSDAPDGTVVREELRGYTVPSREGGRRVLRAAEVVVARALPPARSARHSENGQVGLTERAAELQRRPGVVGEHPETPEDNPETVNE